MHQLLDGMDYSFIRFLDDVRPDDLEQLFWDFLNPDILYYVDRSTGDLVRYSVGGQSHEILVNLAEASGCESEDGGRGDISLGNDVQMMSWDSDWISFRCGNESAFNYQLSSGQLNQFTLADVAWVAPMPSPSGSVFAHGSTLYGADGQRLMELNKGSTEHGNIGVMADGSDAYFAVAFADGPQGGCGGNLVAHDLTTGGCFNVIGEDLGYAYSKSGTHVSAGAYQNPGWVAASMMGFEQDGQSLLDQELVIAYVAGPDEFAVYRIGHHRADEDEYDYWGEPHAVISPSGTRVLFGSDWSGADDGHSVDAYVVELPAFTG